VTGRAVWTEFRQAVADPGHSRPSTVRPRFVAGLVEPGRGQASIRLGDEETGARHVSNILTMLGLPTGHRLGAYKRNFRKAQLHNYPHPVRRWLRVSPDAATPTAA
jgi:hypothetical protein